MLSLTETGILSAFDPISLFVSPVVTLLLGLQSDRFIWGDGDVFLFNHLINYNFQTSYPIPTFAI